MEAAQSGERSGLLAVLSGVIYREEERRAAESREEKYLMNEFTRDMWVRAEGGPLDGGQCHLQMVAQVTRSLLGRRLEFKYSVFFFSIHLNVIPCVAEALTVPHKTEGSRIKAPKISLHVDELTINCLYP